MKFLLILMLFSIPLVMAEDTEPQVGDEVAISVQNRPKTSTNKLTAELVEK